MEAITSIMLFNSTHHSVDAICYESTLEQSLSGRKRRDRVGLLLLVALSLIYILGLTWVTLVNHSRTAIYISFIMANKRKQLSQAEIWDDSALLQSWEDALEEYKAHQSVPSVQSLTNLYISFIIVYMLKENELKM